MIRFAKFAAAALLLSASPAALAQSAGWTVSEVSGAVMIQDAAGKHAAKRGTVVAEGATLSTGVGARAVVVRGKDFMTVNANSRVRIPARAGQRGVLEVLQDWGNALFQIEKKPNPNFGVRTPYLAAVVKGTTFSITVTEQGSSLQVVEGAVETSTSDGGARELIRPGSVAIVSAADRYRLTVQAQNTRTIDSPLRSAPGAMAPQSGDSSAPTTSGVGNPEAVTADEQVEDAVPNSGETTTAAAEVQMIETTINAAAANLGKVTGGLVEGSTGIQVASVDVAAVRTTTGDLRSAAEGKSGSHDTGAGKDNENLTGNGLINGGKLGEPDNGAPGKPDDGNPGKPDNGSPGKPDDGSPGKPDDGNPGKPDDGNPGKPDDGSPGKPDDGNPGKPDDGNPGKPDDGNPGKPDDGSPGKPDDGSPGKPDDGSPGKPDDGNPGKPDDGNPGKPDDGNPGKPDDGNPGKPDDGNPGKPDDGNPGKPDDGNPGKPDDGGPGKPDDGSPGKPDDGGPGKPDDGGKRSGKDK